MTWMYKSLKDIDLVSTFQSCMQIHGRAVDEFVEVS